MQLEMAKANVELLCDPICCCIPIFHMFMGLLLIFSILFILYVHFLQLC